MEGLRDLDRTDRRMFAVLSLLGIVFAAGSVSAFFFSTQVVCGPGRTCWRSAEGELGVGLAAISFLCLLMAALPLKGDFDRGTKDVRAKPKDHRWVQTMGALVVGLGVLALGASIAIARVPGQEDGAVAILGGVGIILYARLTRGRIDA